MLSSLAHFQKEHIWLIIKGSRRNFEFVFGEAELKFQEECVWSVKGRKSKLSYMFGGDGRTWDGGNKLWAHLLLELHKKADK